MSEIIERNKIYLVKSQYGTYTFNNKQSAEQLNKTLTNYETIQQQYTKTEQTLDRVQKGIIQLQMSLKIAQEDLDKLKKELNI